MLFGFRVALGLGFEVAPGLRVELALGLTPPFARTSEERDMGRYCPGLMFMVEMCAHPFSFLISLVTLHLVRST